MIKIAIVTLGHIKHRLDTSRLTKWKSEIFQITDVDSIRDLPDRELDWQLFADHELEFINPSSEADITIAITEYALEDNFYLRRLDNNITVLSLYQTADACEWNDIPLENFILRNIYELCAILKLERRIPSTTDRIPDIIHDDTRSCIFDMCGIKTDIIYSASQPGLCNQCRARLSSSQITSGFLNNLEKELRKIRKPLYYRITGFIKTHPLWTIAITIGAGLVTNMASSFLYDLLT